MSDTKFYIFTGTLIILFLVFIFGGLIYFDKRQCNSIGRYSNIATQYRGLLDGGCYVEVNGRFIPKENWRGEYER